MSTSINLRNASKWFENSEEMMFDPVEKEEYCEL